MTGRKRINGMTKNYLITGYYFNAYTGSMMHICEIAQGLSQSGWNVTIATMCLTEEIRKYVAQLGNVKVEMVWHMPNNMHFDAALCYHFPILPQLLRKGIVIERILFGSLSGFEPLEFPPLCLSCKDYYLQVHSHELFKQMITEHGISSSQLLLVPNTVPDHYYEREIKDTSLRDDLAACPHPRRVAVVSNHVPEELRLAQKHLIEKEITVTFYGVADNHVPITPSILQNYDVVITIGKTVQYCMALGIPVYEYDHFGGAGYITKQNVSLEEQYNFSGRATRRKLSDTEICEELLSQYSFARQQTESLRNYSHKYQLSQNIKSYYANPRYLTSFNADDVSIFQVSKMQRRFLDNELKGVGRMLRVTHYGKIACGITWCLCELRHIIKEHT